MDRAMAAARAGFEFPLKSFKLKQGELDRRVLRNAAGYLPR